MLQGQQRQQVQDILGGHALQRDNKDSRAVQYQVKICYFLRASKVTYNKAVSPAVEEAMATEFIVRIPELQTCLNAQPALSL